MPAPEHKTSLFSKLLRHGLRHGWKVLLLVAIGLLIWRLIGDRDRDDLDWDVLPEQAARFHVDTGLLGDDVDGAARQLGLTAQTGNVELLIDLEDDQDGLEATIEAQLGFDMVLNSVYADEANLFRVQVAAADAQRVLDALSAIDGVELAEINGVMEAFEVSGEASAAGKSPNDPLYMFQWNFEQVGAEAGWEMATGEGVVVAVIDTGVAFEEGRKGRKRGILVPDLKSTHLTAGYDFVDDDDKPYDQHGHGTHVAGTVAQSTNNGYGVAGLAYGAKIMPLRVLDGQGRGNFADVADAIRYAADYDADVLNLSLGAFVPSREVESAIAYAHEKGVVVVAAAGNSGSRVRSYPAAFDHVIAVAATQYDRSATFYSNYGKYVDIAAPGGNTMVDQNNDGKPDGIMQETLKQGRNGAVEFEPVFALYMGTSMASPHVAAAAALLIEQGITHPDEVERVLTQSAADAGKDGWDEHFGHGILDVSAALRGQALSRGLMRAGFALLLSLLIFWLLRRRDPATFVGASKTSYLLGWGLGAGALFFLPVLLGQTAGWNAPFGLIGRPLVTWDTALFSSGSQSPLFASVLPALLAVGLLLGSRRGRFLAAGLAISSGAVLLLEVLRPTMDVAWIPGIGLLDQVWLASNAAGALILGYLALKRP